MQLPEEILELHRRLGRRGGRVVVVGGTVRDFLLHRKTSKDLDLEVFGVAANQLEAILKRVGKVQLVGRSFAVWKLQTQRACYDISLPRHESKSGPGHRGFEVHPDPSLSYAEAARRRDFTINSIGFDIESKTWLDPYGGLPDLQKRILKHVSPAFSEDPLRVLRAARFAACLGFQVPEATLALCRTLNLHELPHERVFEELKRLLLEAKAPSIGLEVMRKTDALQLFPEVQRLVQWDTRHHTRLLWPKTLAAIDGMAAYAESNGSAHLTMMLAALAHALGQPLVNKRVGSRWSFPRHPLHGQQACAEFLQRLTPQRELCRAVPPLVRVQQMPDLLYRWRKTLKRGTLRKLAVRVPPARLARLSHACHAWENSGQAHLPAVWLHVKAQKLGVLNHPPTPFLQGKDLLEFGASPGPPLGAMLRKAFELQLEGEFRNRHEAMRWAENAVLTCS